MHQSLYSEVVAVLELEVEVKVKIEVVSPSLGSSVGCETLVGWWGLFVMFPSVAEESERSE